MTNEIPRWLPPLPLPLLPLLLLLLWWWIVLHNDAEMRQVAKLAEMYHEQKMKQTEKTRKQQQLLDSQKQQSASTTVSTSASSESNTPATTAKESKAARASRRKQRKNEKEEAKTDQQPSPPLPEHAPTPIQVNQPLFFDVEDPILKERFKNQLKRHNRLLESHKEMAQVQKEAIDLQKMDVGKRLMTRIYDQVNSIYDDSLFSKTYNMQLNRLAVIDRRAMKMEMAESTKKSRELSLSFGDFTDSPVMQGEWPSSPFVRQQHSFEFDDEDEYDEEYDDEEEGGLFSDHARMMQEMDDYDYTKERRTLTAVRQALKQHAKFSAESELDDEHSEKDKKHDVRDKALEAAVEAAVDRHMRLERNRRKRAFMRHLKKSNNKKGWRKSFG